MMDLESLHNKTDCNDGSRKWEKQNLAEPTRFNNKFTVDLLQVIIQRM